MRAILPALLVLIQLPAFAAQSQPVCEIQDTTYDSKDVLCSIPTAPEVRRFEFVANSLAATMTRLQASKQAGTISRSVAMMAAK